MNVPEQPPFLGRSKGRPSFQLHCSAEVVQQRRREQQVGPQPWMELSGFAAKRCDAHGVL